MGRQTGKKACNPVFPVMVHKLHYIGAHWIVPNPLFQHWITGGGTVGDCCASATPMCRVK